MDVGRLVTLTECLRSKLDTCNWKQPQSASGTVPTPLRGQTWLAPVILITCPEDIVSAPIALDVFDSIEYRVWTRPGIQPIPVRRKVFPHA